MSTKRGNIKGRPMARAPFQVLIFPYHFKTGTEIEYAIFKRSDFHEEVWQGLAGGGEDDETPLEAARREAWEEAGISSDAPFLALDSMATVPVIHSAMVDCGVTTCL